MSDVIHLTTDSPSARAESGTEHVGTCWNRIGVHGDSSCPELPKFIHCRNCGIFSQAAHRLLDRPLPEEYRREWSAHFAQEKKRPPQAKVSVVVFRINNEWLALPTQAFQEVAEQRRIHSLPHRRHGFVLGLANIRGELLICVALEKLLALDRAAAGHRARTTYERLMVAAWEGTRVVFPVDEVQGIYRFHAQELREPPSTVTKSNGSFSDGLIQWRDRVVGSLNPALLFSSLNQNLK